ncbi:hypothetical protein [Chryseobacterium daecheongense]|uniref:Uncharacterized protein n=1 Tax=Chryseobacterium daecheongense TaxID=192389 RepID=A0A3N0VXX4_9FLAO|nr:hypothetical protein [Chryseobacterium daecheongense]ROH97652.1 hypothetical protein EGI05_09725 [Chryseobacterium daecheongense]TDX93192.1 hypothetical protein BCF50_2149 [Chryseobacterium daecheongense]
MAKKKKTGAYIILLLVLLFVGRFFSGVYEDDEFSEKYFFIKSSPTWKWHFYSPRGMSDQKLEEMSPDQQKEQIMFEKYIPNRLFSFPI